MNTFNSFKCLLTVVVIAAWSLCTVSCMHTVIGGGGEECYSPSGGKYGRYHVGIEAHGASARAYTDYTKKWVFLVPRHLEWVNRMESDEVGAR